MIATPASLRSDFIHIVGMAIHIAPECTNHITGIRTKQLQARLKAWASAEVMALSSSAQCSLIKAVLSPTREPRGHSCVSRALLYEVSNEHQYFNGTSLQPVRN